MTQASDPNRLDRIEATLETVVLAIRELSNRSSELGDRQDRTQDQLDQLQRTVEANSHQIALNSEQITEMRAGIVGLQNILADYIASQGR